MSDDTTVPQDGEYYTIPGLTATQGAIRADIIRKTVFGLEAAGALGVVEDVIEPHDRLAVIIRMKNGTAVEIGLGSSYDPAPVRCTHD